MQPLVLGIPSQERGEDWAEPCRPHRPRERDGGSAKRLTPLTSPLVGDEMNEKLGGRSRTALGRGDKIYPRREPEEQRHSAEPERQAASDGDESLRRAATFRT